jgi:carboxypeptidase A4
VVWNACVGTDINRNWNIKWFSPGGASINPCDQDYKGPLPPFPSTFANGGHLGPFVGSTPEFKALSSFQNSKAFSQGVKLFMDIHSYSQFWMIRVFPPPNFLLD